MKTALMRSAAILVACSFSAASHAMPITVDYTDIVVDTLEDFESLTPFIALSANESFSGFDASLDTGAWFPITGRGPTCLNATDNCLTNFTQSVEDTRTFSFSAGTNYFGVELGLINPTLFPELPPMPTPT